MINSFKEEKGNLLFELEKLLGIVVENIFRVQCIWNHAIEHIEKLLSLEQAKHRRIGVKAICYLIVNVFHYWKIQKNISGWPVDKWQVHALSPLTNTECIYEKIGMLPYVLENCHLYINKEGWEVVLKVISQAVTFAASSTAPPVMNERIERAFKCLEMLIFYIDQIHTANAKELLKLILSFISAKNNSEISLTSVEFILNISDHLFRQQRKGLSEEAAKIWPFLFDTLKEIGNSPHGDIRDSSYRIIEQIVSNHLKDLPANVIAYVTTDVAKRLLDFVQKNYSKAKKSISEDNPDLTEVHAWEKSVKILNRGLVNIICRMNRLEGEHSLKGNGSADAWRVVLKSWEKLLQADSYEIHLAVYDSIRQLLKEAKDCIYISFDYFWQVFSSPVPMHSQRLVSELSTAIMDIIRQLFTKAAAKVYRVVTEKNLKELFEVLKSILWSMSATEAITENVELENSIQANDIFDFVEYLPTLFDNDIIYTEYVNFLLSFLDFQPNDPRSEEFIRRVLLIIKHMAMAYATAGIIKASVPSLYHKLASIISLRFQNTLALKAAQPLWYDAGKYFINLSTYIVNPKVYKQVGANVAEKLLSNVVLPVVESPSKLSPNKEMQDLAWTHIIKVIRSTLKPDSAPSYGERFIGEDTVKKSQDLDLMIVNFILKVLLPSSCDRPYEVQLDLVRFIDDGCTAFDSTFSNVSGHAKASDTLSKYCTSELINLCSWKGNSSADPARQKIAAIATPVLLNRCKHTFTSYILDEKRSGQVPLPR